MGWQLFFTPSFIIIIDVLSGSPQVAAVHSLMTGGGTATQSGSGSDGGGGGGGGEHICPHGHKKHHPAVAATQRRSETITVLGSHGSLVPSHRFWGNASFLSCQVANEVLHAILYYLTSLKLHTAIIVS